LSEKSDRIKLEFILRMIENISVITARHGGPEPALQDIEGQNAILMCLLQIGETLNRMESPQLQAHLPVRQAYSVRNFIAHDYGSIDLATIREIITLNLPELKKTIEKLLSA
jgi:uncharacterized protein with HEPN domain